jgi:hypothetical protein
MRFLTALFSPFNRLTSFLARVIDEDASESRKGFAVVVGIGALALSVTTLSIAGLYGMMYPDAFSAACWSLATCVGAVYGIGKVADNVTSSKEPPP